MSDTGAKLDSANEVKIPWLPSCYLAVRVWALTWPWKADLATGSGNSDQVKDTVVSRGPC